MQLKRNTDYALRILLCVAEYPDENGIPLPKLCKHSSIPHTIAVRLCRKLVDENILTETTIGNRTFFAINPGANNITLYDVILAIEGTVDLFAVFDHSTELYMQCGDNLNIIEEWLTKGLKEINIRELTDIHVLAEN